MALASASAQDWVALFDGQSLAGWKASENPGSPRVEDGAIVCEGKRAHLFYVGADGQAEFENFELEVEVKTEPGANSGVYFLTKWQDKGWPDAGFEAQVNNRQPTFKEYDYRENKKTASLYGLRNLYKPLAQDGEWFTLNVRVARPRVQIRLNGRLVSDYIEPANPVLPSPGPKLNLLGQGTFALQCHDEDSRARYRNIRVRRLPPGEDASVTKPVLSEQDLRRLALGKDNFPIVNLRVRAGEISPEQLDALRTQTGIFPGIVFPVSANGIVRDEATALAAIAGLQDQPVFFGLDVSSDWIEGNPRLSAATYAKFDFLVVSNRPGLMLINPPLGVDEDQYLTDDRVAQIVYRIETQPIDVYANVMALPSNNRSRAEELWTEERMQRVIAAAAKHGVAFEINLRERTPSEKFIRLAKAAKVKFTAGSDDTTLENYTDWSYFLEMQKAVGLGWRDMWVPGHGPTRAQRELAKP
jgi:hypothetical protein